MAQNIPNLIRQVGSQMGLTPAQIRAMLATAKVESGFDPSIVGDNGTSYGLFQMHVGGAGGSTHASAQRYLDPVTAIRNRARYFRDQNITSGAGAAALQRPADPAGYARKVEAAMRGLSGGGGGGGGATLGLGGDLAATPAPAGPDRIAQLQSVRDRLAKKSEDPYSLAGKPTDLRARTSSLREQLSAMNQPQQSAVPDMLGDVPNIPIEGGSYKDILKLGSQFGLRIDGSNQTTGGNHTEGSYHYKGRAVDFGDAKNNPAQLKRLAAWARKNHGRIREFFYDPLGWYIKDGKIIKGSIGGHGDHVHIAM